MGSSGLDKGKRHRKKKEYIAEVVEHKGYFKAILLLYSVFLLCSLQITSHKKKLPQVREPFTIHLLNQ